MKGRWVVVDVETSGLDARRDALISIAGLGVTDGEIDLADSFEVVLRQVAPSSHANIEVHGIAQAEQRAGVEPEAALHGFLEFIGQDPLVAFHAPFDAAVLSRALGWRRSLPTRRWLDLAEVAPLAWPGRADARGGLDAWLAALDIPIRFRHRAIVDCLATAQLLLAVLQAAAALGVDSPRQLLALGRSRRWLG